MSNSIPLLCGTYYYIMRADCSIVNNTTIIVLNNVYLYYTIITIKYRYNYLYEITLF